MRRLLPLLLLLALGCGTQGSLYTAALQPLPLVAAGTAAVQVVPQTGRAVVLRPGEATPTALRVSPGARAAFRVPTQDVVVVLAGTARAPLLDVLDLAAGEVQSLPLPGPFDTVTFDATGRWGVFTFLATSGTGTLVARNLNEVALFDTAARTVTRLQLDTESLAPRGVLFGPAEANRRLVCVTLERGVAVFDALHPEVAPRRIAIRPQGSTAETSVLEAVFSRDARWLFLRATGLDDVIAIELGAEVGAPVSASINFVAGGRGLSDLEVAPEGFSDAVLAVFAASREAWLLDARGIQDQAKRLQLSEAVTRLAPLTGTRVFLWDGNGGRTVAAWDVADGRSGSVLLDGPVTAPLVLPALQKALVFHPSTQSAGAALSSVTVAEEVNRLRLRLQGIQLLAPAQGVALDAAGGRLFFSVKNAPSVVTLELSTLQLAEMALDAPPAALWHLEGGDWLLADHRTAGRYGDATVWPAGSTERSSARRYSDYAFTGDLDRPEDL